MGPHFLRIHQIWWNILISGGYMPPKRNSKQRLWQCNSTSGSNFDAGHPSGTFTSHVEFQPNRTIRSRVIAILAFYPVLPLLGSHLWWCFLPTSPLPISIVAGQRWASGLQKDNFRTVGQWASGVPCIWKPNSTHQKCPKWQTVFPIDCILYVS